MLFIGPHRIPSHPSTPHPTHPSPAPLQPNPAPPQVLAADTLTELIRDNEEIVDRLERDGLVEMFLKLIRSVGRKAR